jgi:uncharacterized coiled-coil protein SlyX
MTLDPASILSLLVRLNDTITAQQQTIDALHAEIARLTADQPQEG